MWRTKHIQKPGLVSRSGGCINSFSLMEPTQKKKTPNRNYKYYNLTRQEFEPTIYRNNTDALNKYMNIQCTIKYVNYTMLIERF